MSSVRRGLQGRRKDRDYLSVSSNRRKSEENELGYEATSVLRSFACCVEMWTDDIPRTLTYEKNGGCGLLFGFSGGILG
jgi:hypothetical protein